MRKSLIALVASAGSMLLAPGAVHAGTEDVAGIRGAARSFVAALYDGDVARAERLAYARESQRAVIEVMALRLGSEAKLTAAVDRAFGVCNDHDPAALANVLQVIARSDVDLGPNADTAELGRPGMTLPMRLTGDGWKVDVIELSLRREISPGALARARQRAAEVDRLVADVDAGKYASAADVLDARENEATASIE